MCKAIAVGMLTIVAAGAAFAQEFEVASIRPDLANDRIVTLN